MPDLNNDILLQAEKQDSKLYRRTLWWVEHRDRLGKIGIILLMIFDACLVLFVLWSLADAFLLSAGAERRALVDAVSLNQEDLHAYTVARAATPISLSNAQAFALGNNKYDFYVSLENTNEDWWAEFEYQFVYDGGSTPVKKGFILPASSKPVTELAFSSEAAVVNAQFQFQTISWHRIDHKVIKDYATWSKDRLGLEILNPTLTQDTTIDAKGLFRTTFTVRNRTAFSYNNPSFHLLLKRGAAVVAVNKTTLQSLAPGEAQDVVVNWFGSVPSASQVEIIPDLNLFDPMLYKELVGSPTIDTRSIQ